MSDEQEEAYGCGHFAGAGLVSSLVILSPHKPFTFLGFLLSQFSSPWHFAHVTFKANGVSRPAHTGSKLTSLTLSDLKLIMEADTSSGSFQSLRQFRCEEDRNIGRNLNLIRANMIACRYLAANLSLPILDIPFKPLCGN